MFAFGTCQYDYTVLHNDTTPNQLHIDGFNNLFYV